MKGKNQIYLSMFCAFVLAIGVLTFSFKSDTAYGKVMNGASIHETTPTRAMMQVIRSHTSRILDAILNGDFQAVLDETKKVNQISRNIADMFFPEGGEGREFKIHGDAESKKATKKELEKYLKIITNSSEKIAASARDENIVETYKNFDAMIINACFACHTASRTDWPNWIRAAGD
ncbi:MAG: hypothetical protein GY941_30785 [Planctomycetes bacterium]|nr:hypothetical protein [Planctomycetota bacterium]